VPDGFQLGAVQPAIAGYIARNWKTKFCLWLNAIFLQAKEEKE